MIHSLKQKVSGSIRAPNVTRLCIWSIKNHDWLIARLREYVWSACGLILLLAAFGAIGLQAALLIVAFGCMGIIVVLTGLVLTRRNHLLNLTDPELKNEVYSAMIALIQQRQ